MFRPQLGSARRTRRSSVSRPPAVRNAVRLESGLTAGLAHKLLEDAALLIQDPALVRVIGEGDRLRRLPVFGEAKDDLVTREDCLDEPIVRDVVQVINNGYVNVPGS